MRRVLEGLAGPIAAGMARHLRDPVDEPHRGRAREEGQGVADARVGNRVAIPIEADVGRLARAHGPHQVGGKGMGG